MTRPKKNATIYKESVTAYAVKLLKAGLAKNVDEAYRIAERVAT